MSAWRLLTPLVLALALPDRALADGPPRPEPLRLRSGFASQDRPVGMAEFNIGALTLPGAEICGATTDGAEPECTRGDASFEIEAWPLYRPTVRYAFGAGIMLGLIPTTIPAQQSTNDQTVVRDHSRSYLTAEGIGRYYLYVGESTELWAGVTAGLVVLSDRFVVESGVLADRALVGRQGVTIRTEGGAVGIAVGGAYGLAQNWSLGAVLRYGQWFLPNTPAEDPLGSQASLVGRNSYLTLGVGVTYRSVL
jgi:hypothetical protein